MDNEYILFDRIEAIKNVINQYGQDKFFLSFSGGKDSVVLHYLLDMALPNNQIPRVFINTGIEYNDMVKFVVNMQMKDKRIEIIRPNKSIKKVLEDYGYPFKSKEHSQKVSEYQKDYILYPYLQRYIEGKNKDGTKSLYKCPIQLRYQFSKECNLKISNRCCFKLKKEPIHK